MIKCSSSWKAQKLGTLEFRQVIGRNKNKGASSKDKGASSKGTNDGV